MAAGLFYVYTEPGTGGEAEFNDWYDHEHGPARLAVPGFGGALRYRALDDQKPTWLALYELDGPEVIESPGYRALAGRASARDKAVSAGLAALERRVYEQISEDGSPAGRPAPVILSVSPEVLEEPGYRAAISTPWRDRVVASALRRERREFGLRNAIGA